MTASAPTCCSAQPVGQRCTRLPVIHSAKTPIRWWKQAANADGRSRLLAQTVPHLPRSKAPKDPRGKGSSSCTECAFIWPTICWQIPSAVTCEQSVNMQRKQQHGMRILYICLKPCDRGAQQQLSAQTAWAHCQPAKQATWAQMQTHRSHLPAQPQKG